MKKLGLVSAESAAKRYVASQPTVFPSAGGQKDIFNIRFNQRKITELVGKITGDVKLAHELLIGDVEMLMGYVNHHQWTQVMNTLIDVASGSGSSERETAQAALVQKALLMSYTSWRGNIHMIGPSLQSRLLVYYPSMPYITQLMKNIDSVGLAYCALVNPSMQMESPGGEMVYIMNNHQGSVNDITSTIDDVYGDSDDDEASISISQKLVAIDMEAGEVISDFRPLIPEDDSFKKVVYVSRVYKKQQSSVPNLCVGALSKHPWLYIFTVMPDSAETLGIIKIEQFTDNKDFAIHELWTTGRTEIFVTGHNSREVFVFHDLLAGGKLLATFTAEEEVVCSSLALCDDDRNVYGNDSDSDSDSDNSKRQNLLLLVHTDSASLLEHTLTAPRSTYLTKVASLPLPKHGKMTAYSSMAEGACVAAFEDGTICIIVLIVKDQDQPSLALGLRNLGFQKVHFIAVAGTLSNYQYRSQEANSEAFVLCTDSQLILMLDSPDGECNVVAKVNKFYTAANLSYDSLRIFAYTDGTVDVFEVEQKKGKIRQLVSIDAHGAPITKLMIHHDTCKCFAVT
jgi:hypothetical protein